MCPENFEQDILDNIVNSYFYLYTKCINQNNCNKYVYLYMSIYRGRRHLMEMKLFDILPSGTNLSNANYNSQITD
jgi:hypothetical protein